MDLLPSLHVFVSGFGSPHIEEKIRILWNNMSNINRYKWSKIQYTICCYDNSDMTQFEKHSNITIIRDRLIVGQYIQKYLVPGTESTSYDYILCILDDIELQNDIDWGKIIHYSRYFQIDIISPSMTLDSKYQFIYMLHDKNHSTNCIKITAALEYFCYFMTSESYNKYYPHVDGNRNPWMWGLDMVLNKHLCLRLGIINHMTMKHWYKNESYSLHPETNPCDGYNYVLKKYNDTTDGLAMQKSIFYIIYDIGIPTIKKKYETI